MVEIRIQGGTFHLVGVSKPSPLSSNAVFLYPCVGIYAHLSPNAVFFYHYVGLYAHLSPNAVFFYPCVGIYAHLSSNSVFFYHYEGKYSHLLELPCTSKSEVNGCLKRTSISRNTHTHTQKETNINAQAIQWSCDERNSPIAAFKVTIERIV